MSNVRHIPMPEEYSARVRELIPNDATQARGPDMEARERIAAYIRRVWPENTAAKLATALGRMESTAMARAIIECRRDITFNDFRLLHAHPQFGMPFVREALGLEPDTEREALIYQARKLLHDIRKI